LPKVFSVNNFNGGLDVRKTTLTAPGGTLRVLENAYVNSGGEIEKRFALVTVATLNMATVPPPYAFGQAGQIHVFGVGAAPVIPANTSPHPIVPHALAAAPEQIVEIIDVEAFDGNFYVIGIAASGTTYVWYKDLLVLEADGSQSHGTFARTYKTKMYRIDGKRLRFSGVNNPAINDPSSTTNPGAGFINMAINDPDGENLLSMEVYYNQMAVSAPLLTQVWTLDPDPSLDTLGQMLRSGVIAPHSMLQFGTGDVLFLSNSGVRSLKAMNINLAAAVSDVGSAIDPLLVDLIRQAPGQAHPAIAVVQPIQGRYWLHINGIVYVLSYYPAASITAWSTFVLGYTAKNLLVCEDRVYLLDANGNLRLYGGVDGKTYDNCKVTVITPHMHATASTEQKRITAVDVMCVGAWSIEIGLLPNRTDLFELIANVQDNTYGLATIPCAGKGSHIGVRMINQSVGPAILAAIHLNIEEAATKGGSG
jgi:hypothetical protein